MILRDPQLVHEITGLAKRAGAVILHYYERGAAVRAKRDTTPVTEADEAAEAVILPGLAELTSDIPIIAEEAVAAGRIPKIGDKPFWLVDPLDGTREFLSRNGEFTVNIALIEGGVPAMGVVHAPALGLTFAANGPGTAVRERGAEHPCPISARTCPPEGAVVLASRSHGDRERLERFLAGVKVQSLRAAGSSIKFCLIASGEADLYPRFGRTMEWDTAAGHAILLAAGGMVETLDGRPLFYGKKDFANPDFIARGRSG